jgi:histidinol-phosphate aminotransferase
MTALSKRVRANIHALKAYEPGKPIEEIEREHGIRGAVKLASNESPLGPSEAVIEALHAALPELHRYPDGACYKLRAELAARLAVAPKALVFGTGSDEILELLAKVFLDAGDDVVFAWPSFTMYPLIAQGMGARSVQIPLDAGYQVDVERLADAVTPRTKLVFVANPNNPTGVSLGAAEIERLLARVPDDVVVVLDEAYCEYVRRADYPRSLEYLASHANLVIMRTFSKIHGLAGLRIGYAIASPELCGFLERARHPFNVNSLAQVAATAALCDEARIAHVRSLTHAGLAQLEKGLAELGLSHPPTDANFLLVDVGIPAHEMAARLECRGVITRSMAAFGLVSHLRITVGMPEENARVLTALLAELGTGGHRTG